MSNPETGAVGMEIAGKTYHLILNVNALAELEEAMSTREQTLPYPLILIRAKSGSARYLRAVIWAALREHHGEMTLKDAGELIEQAGGLTAFSRQLALLGESTEPDPKDVAELKAGAGENPRSAQKAKRAGAGRTSPHGASV